MALTKIHLKICRFHGSLSQKGSRPLQSRAGGEPIYHNEPHKSWNIAGGPQKITLIVSSDSTFIFLRKLRRENYVNDRETLLLSYCLLVVEFRFDAMLCYSVGNENAGAGRINYSHAPHLAREPQVHHPCRCTEFPMLGGQQW